MSESKTLEQLLMQQTMSHTGAVPLTSTFQLVAASGVCKKKDLGADDVEIEFTAGDLVNFQATTRYFLTGSEISQIFSDSLNERMVNANFDLSNFNAENLIYVYGEWTFSSSESMTAFIADLRLELLNNGFDIEGLTEEELVELYRANFGDEALSAIFYFQAFLTADVAALLSTGRPFLDNDPDDSNSILFTKDSATLEYFNVAYVGGAGVSIVDTDFSLQDINSSIMYEAKITLFKGDTGSPNEFLSLTIPGGNPLTKSTFSDDEYFQITLSGAGTIAEYEAAIKAITYEYAGAVDDDDAYALRQVDINVKDEVGYGFPSPTRLLVTSGLLTSDITEVTAGLGGVDYGAFDLSAVAGLTANAALTFSDLALSQGSYTGGSTYTPLVILHDSAANTAYLTRYVLDITSPEVTAIGSLANINAVYGNVGDINGDGRVDIMLGSTNLSEVVLIDNSANNPSTFTVGTTFTIANNTTDVSGAGDVNGDGYGDFLIGSSNGDAYLVYGKDGGFAATENLTALTGADGTLFTGATGNVSVTGIGDFNRDGFDDFMIGDKSFDNDGLGNDNNGRAYIVFGQAGSYGNTQALGVDALALDNTLGAHGDEALFGAEMVALGDVNGDGYDDVLVSAAGYNGGQGAAYILYGEADRDASVRMTRITGEAVGDNFGASIASAGDFNGDGYRDIIIGAPNSGEEESNAGAAYIIFGRANFAATPSASVETLMDSGAGGMTIYGSFANELFGSDVGGGSDNAGWEVGAFDDVMVANGTGGVNYYNGYYSAGVAKLTPEAEADNDTLIGGNGIDTFTSNGHTGLVMRGGLGDDTFILQRATLLTAGTVVDGGASVDSLRFTEADVALNFTQSGADQLDFSHISDIEAIELTGGGTVLTLDAAFLSAAVSTSNFSATYELNISRIDTPANATDLSTVVFADGADWLRLGSGLYSNGYAYVQIEVDSIKAVFNGTVADDAFLIFGADNTTFNGLGGSDTFVIYNGADNYTINGTSDAGDINTLALGEDMTNINFSLDSKDAGGIDYTLINNIDKINLSGDTGANVLTLDYTAVLDMVDPLAANSALRIDGAGADSVVLGGVIDLGVDQWEATGSGGGYDFYTYDADNSSGNSATIWVTAGLDVSGGGI